MPGAYKWFTFSAGIIFLVTGSAKVWSGLGSAELLRRLDPILNMQFGHLMLVAGMSEIVCAVFCLLKGAKTSAVALVAFLAGSLMVYRLGLWWLGWHSACSCLGNLTDALHIPPQTADGVMKIILAYLLVGSYGALFWLWRQRKRAFASASAQ